MFKNQCWKINSRSWYIAVSNTKVSLMTFLFQFVTFVAKRNLITCCQKFSLKQKRSGKKVGFFSSVRKKVISTFWSKNYLISHSAKRLLYIFILNGSNPSFNNFQSHVTQFVYILNEAYFLKGHQKVPFCLVISITRLVS